MSSIDIETVFELWEKIKPCIPAKDKLEVLENQYTSAELLEE